MNREEKRKFAKEILKAEDEISLGKSVKSNQDKIENIMCHLNFAEMLELDDYIMQIYNKK
jgi:hypothetical protein